MNQELIDKARQNGIDPEQVKQDVINNYGNDFSEGVINNLTESAINERIKAQNLETVTGLVTGYRDRQGKNWPVKISLLSRDGNHKEVSTWGRTIGDKDIPTGQVTEIAAEYNEDYDSYNAKHINATDTPDTGIINIIKDLAVNPSDISQRDEYTIQVIKGTLNYINPLREFNDDNEPIGDHPIMMPDKDDNLLPHLQFVIGGNDEDVQVRGYLEQQKLGRPMTHIQGFTGLVEAAYDQHDNPRQQCKLVGNGLRGTPVALVGSISKIDKYRDDDGTSKTSIDINLSGVFQIGEMDTSDIGGTSESPAQPDQEPQQDTGTDTSTDELDMTGEVEDSPVNELATQIRDYSDAIGADPGDFAADDIKGALDLDAPLGVVKEALRRLEEGNQAVNVSDGKPQATDLAAKHGGDCPFCSYDGDFLKQHLKASHGDKIQQ